jgi:hypothetical protein
LNLITALGIEEPEWSGGHGRQQENPRQYH